MNIGDSQTVHTAGVEWVPFPSVLLQRNTTGCRSNSEHVDEPTFMETAKGKTMPLFRHERGFYVEAEVSWRLGCVLQISSCGAE